MKLKRLAINRLPGISQPFEIEAAGAGFHVVFGPNGIGKSSICRAVEGLYWEDRGSSRPTSVTGEFELDGETWWGEREGARTRWQRGGENNVSPNLPPSHNSRCFFLNLRDLIDPSRDGTADIASEIRRQMSGGFDLDRIASNLFTGVTPQRSRRERNDFNKAAENVQEAVGRHADLQRRADQLEELKTELHDAETATHRLTLVERAIGLARRREELVGIVERIKALPGALANLTGKEVEEIERQQAQVDRFAERARSLERELGEAREARRESGLAHPPEPADLAAWREDADELERLEVALAAAKSERSVTRGRLAAALHAMGGGDVDKVALTLPEQGELFEFLRSSQVHAARVGAVQERLRLLGRIDAPRDGQRDIETLRDATEALRSWLRVSEPDSSAIRVRARWPWLLSALVVLSASAGLAAFVDPSLILLAAAGVAIALPVLVLGNRKTSRAGRNAARAAFEKLGLEEPDEWEIPSVESRLRTLEGEIGDLLASLQRARDRGVERQTLEAELEGLSEQRRTLDARRQELKGRLGLDTLPQDAELVDFARALDQLRLARGDDQAAAGKVGGLEERHAALLAELAGVLEHHGEPRPTSAATARARLNNLTDRNSRLVRAISDERAVTGQLEENSAAREGALGSIRKIYSEAALKEGDLGGLILLLDSLQRYRELNSEKARFEGQIGLDCAELEKAGEPELAECDGLSLVPLKDSMTSLAMRASGLRSEIAEITARLNQAKRGSGVQDLIAVREEARARLRDLRDEALYAKAGGYLIDAVEEEYEQTRMPHVFERARDHFSGFTYHNYELRLGKDEGTPRLLAVELRSGEGRELDELSDGTRAQLLLAARIAFAEQVEQGKVLPLFLDEALDQSDPKRFEAIVRSLGRVARDQDRQIFYFTSDPLDVDRIQDALGKEDCGIAASIDLGRIRTNAVSVGGPGALHVDPGPTVPAPNGRSPEEYGAALSVQAFRPALGYAEQHFFYVLWDHLDLLHVLLSNGIERAGQWKTVSGTALAERLDSRSGARPEIPLRLDLLEVFCELWKQGKGRSVGRDALGDSGALTERFLDDVVSIARELDGDPERLVAALGEKKDPRLRGLRSSSARALKHYLIENGYLDDRPILTEGDLQLRALTTPAANRLPDGIASGCLKRWWEWARKISETELP